MTDPLGDSSLPSGWRYDMLLDESLPGQHKQLEGACLCFFTVLWVETILSA